MPVTKEATEITLIGFMEILASLISADSDLGFFFIAF